MKTDALCFSVLAALASLACSTVPPAHSSGGHELAANANHIFNAIHSSLRQWGSSLNHNGMSYFLATVPEGTQLYHGTSKAEPVMGMEWLAFEPEHSILFAGRRGPPRRRPGEEPGKPGEGPPPPPGGGRGPHEGNPSRLANNQQEPLLGYDAPDEDEELGGYLHTYRAARPLRLLYIDGESAAKSNKGTLDSQDYILVNSTDTSGRMGGEFVRAAGLCELAQTEWGGRIDGVLRMEGGFEIILCSFQDRLDVVRINRQQSRYAMHDGQFFDYYRAITARYHGIGGGRVRLDYDRFVTAFDGKYGVDPLFRNIDGRVLPRLQNVTKEQVAMIRADIRALVLGAGSPERSYDWQGVADMIVGRYASRLKYIAALPTLEHVQDEIVNTLQPFIDFAPGKRNASAEAHRCATQFIPVLAPSPAESMGAAAVSYVAHHICSTLTSVGEVESYDAAIQKLNDLIDWLDWTTWKECGACNPDKLCMIPIWPQGSLEDFTNPQCLNATQMQGRRGYWGRRW